MSANFIVKGKKASGADKPQNDIPGFCNKLEVQNNIPSFAIRLEKA
jgi:hypothetical protein